jgi:hypothetical protein
MGSLARRDQEGPGSGAMAGRCGGSACIGWEGVAMLYGWPSGSTYISRHVVRLREQSEIHPPSAEVAAGLAIVG